MKQNLPLEKLIRRLDTSQVGLSVALLKEQILQAHRDFPKRVALPKRRWNAVVVCAMGGSGLGADVLRSLYKHYLKVPLVIVNGYSLPHFADKNTLVIHCSYSGTTEEIISCLAEARSRKLPSFVIAEGGALIAAAKKFRIPHFAFHPDNNPSKQPRIGTGYTMTGMYELLKKQGLLAAGAPDLIAATKQMTIDTEVPFRFAKELLGQSFVVIAAEHLVGNAHVMSNQLNESAKAFAPSYFISELNHHLLEGLGSLKAARKHWTFIFLESKDYMPRTRKRFAITRQVVEKQGFKTKTISFNGAHPVQCLKMLSFSGFFSFYSAILAQKNPASIPWVDYFKKRLA
jgi:glucose/mannose-6-phosphate isomerase